MSLAKCAALVISILCLRAACLPRIALAEPGVAGAEPNASAKIAGGVVVLDALGSWRMHNCLQPPVIQSALGEIRRGELDGQTKIVHAGYYLDHETAPAPEGWMKSDFDDSSWVREAATRSCRTQTLSRLCLRGRFLVADPAKVDRLRLTVEYHGGAAVYLNGKEIARDHLAAGASLAEPYPREAYVGKDGKLLGERGGGDAETQRRYGLRNRRIEELAIPKDQLVAGLNVLAIEIVRAPYDKVMEEQKSADGDRARYDLNWYTCQIVAINLQAGSGAGLTPNARRPQGLQAWNANLLAGDFDIDFGDPTEKLQPIALAGARGGWFSGKIVVGSDKPIRGLKASITDLKGAKGAIPASEVRVRYGMPWGVELLTIHHVPSPSPYPRPVTLMGAMTDQPKAEYAVSQPRAKAPADKTPPGDERLGAVVPIWVTVRVPFDAAAGDYAGQLTIQADGEKPITAAVKLTVIDWKLPAPQDYRTWVEMIQVPDTSSVEYDVPLWSPRHWQYIADAMKYLNEVGSRVLYTPLIAQTNLGNAESMVRWVRKGNNQYEYDFTILDKYLDTAAANMGKPKLVVLDVWEVYMIRKDKYKDVNLSGQPQATLEYRQQKDLMQGTGPVVTVLDRASGKTQNVTLPDYADPNSKALWQPLLAEVRKRLRERGLEGVLALGTVSDFPPTKDEVAFFKEIAPGVPWVVHSHHGGGSLYGGLGSVIYQTRVWNNDFPTGDPAKGRLHGWQAPGLIANYQRESTVMEFTCSAWHNMTEMNIAGQQRGVGRLGADFWDAIRDKNAQRKGTVAARYPMSSRRNLDLYSSMLAPGPDGPVATTRYEAFRQGLQECEARVFIDQALVDKALRPKLGDDLAKRCQDLLDERGWEAIKGMAHLQLAGPGWLYGSWYDMEGPAGHIWFLGSGWEERAQRLFSLAAEVQKKLGAQ